MQGTRTNHNKKLKRISYILYKTIGKMKDSRTSPKYAKQYYLAYSLYLDSKQDLKLLERDLNQKHSNLNFYRLERLIHDMGLEDVNTIDETITNTKNLMENFYLSTREDNIAHSIKYAEDIRKIVFQRDDTTPDGRVRFMLYALLDLLKTENHHQLSANIERVHGALVKMGNVYTRKLFVKIFDELTKEVGVGGHQNIAQNDSERQKSEKETDQNEGVITEYTQLKDTVEVLSEQLNQVRNEYLAYQENSLKEATIEMFKKLNSMENNHILDTLAISNNLISDLFKSGWSPEKQEVESIVLSLKGLMNSFSTLGLKPAYDIGTQMKISSDELGDFEYIGSEFKETKIKKVEVKTPGWRYNGVLIIRPKVKEVGGGQ